jgi:transcription elongation factor Elf1
MSEFPGVKFVQDVDGRCYVDSVSEENLIGQRLPHFPESYHCPVCDGYVKGQPLSEVSYGADRIQGDKTLNIESLLCSICGYELHRFASHT